MKITQEKLKEMVQEAVRSRLDERNDFTAKRQIVHAAQTASMNFEAEIVKLLNLADPDSMEPEAQRYYFEAVEAMKVKVVRAVSEAVKDLSKLPRQESAGEE